MNRNKQILPMALPAADVQTVVREAHDCAVAMLDNATYIERELPNVQMDDSNRVAVSELCSHLIGSKHDIIHELFELSDLLADCANDERIVSKVELFMNWLSDDIRQMHEIVSKLDDAAKRDPACRTAYSLVAESAVNILRPFNRARVAADALKPAR